MTDDEPFDPDARPPHIPHDTATESRFLPKHLSKQEFARRLYTLTLSRGWTQSELGRRSGLPRDSISTYMRGRSLPTPVNLQALAKALGTTKEALLPNAAESQFNEENPSFEIKESQGRPGVVWLRVNRMCSLETAMRIGALLGNDNAVAD